MHFDRQKTPMRLSLAQKIFFTSIIVSLLCSTAPAQQVPTIVLIVPEEDSTVTMSAVYRLSASATPGCGVTLNGIRQHVYRSGAFAGLLQLTIGENIFTIVATDPSGKTATKQFLVTRQAPPQSSRTDTLAIEGTLMRPSADMWLDQGDLLFVQCKGTPGCKATFLNGLSLVEAKPEDAGGLRGIYRATYRIDAKDSIRAQPIVFRLQDSAGNVVMRSSRGFVSVKAAEFPLTGITRGRNPSLSFGLGENRLGGAMMQRLVSGVRLAINGKIGEMYRVRLAEGKEGWIDQDMVDIKTGGTFVPHSLTGNWQVYGDDHYDYVSVSLDERMPYASYQDEALHRIIVDVFGTTSNTNWIIQQLTTMEITNVSYRQEGKDVFRILIDLKHHQAWGFGISYVGTNLVIKVKRQPDRLKIKGLTIVLDAGHGGDNLGARGSTGSLEKNINLSTTLHLKKLLEAKGAAVVLTRGADSSVSMTSRLTAALSSNADLLIAIHSNSVGLTTNPENTRGVSTYYKHIGFRPLSQYILNRVLRTGLPSYGNVGSFNSLLNSPTEMPNALVELAYMSNPEDEMKLMDDEFRRDLAKAIVGGIEDFLDSCDE